LRWTSSRGGRILSLVHDNRSCRCRPRTSGSNLLGKQ
jgi:hypothetical protein